MERLSLTTPLKNPETTSLPPKPWHSLYFPPMVLITNWHTYIQISHTHIFSTIMQILEDTNFVLFISEKQPLAYIRHSINTGWGKSRFTVVSMQNSLFLYSYLLIAVLFSTWRTINYICLTLYLLNIETDTARDWQRMHMKSRHSLSSSNVCHSIPWAFAQSPETGDINLLVLYLDSNLHTYFTHACLQCAKDDRVNFLIA